MEAQERFFRILANVLGNQYVSTTKQINIYAKCERNKYSDERIPKLLEIMRTILKSDSEFSNKKAPIDGLILNHPNLGTRIIEFDELQHFSPERKISLELEKNFLPLSFNDRYLQFLNNDSIIESARRKNMIKGFCKPVCGFKFDGGRICQRAYFDTMKDYAHLSEHGKGLEPIIRFSIPDFGVNTEPKFLRMSEYDIQQRIKYLLGI